MLLLGADSPFLQLCSVSMYVLQHRLASGSQAVADVVVRREAGEYVRTR